MDVTIQEADRFYWQDVASRTLRHTEARYLLPIIGRRGGKSAFARMEAIRTFLLGGIVWWISPTYPMASTAWRELTAMVRQIPGVKIHKGEKYIEGPTGGYLYVKSGTDPNRLRGDGLDGAVLDEAAFMDKDVWYMAVKHALMDRGGWAIFPTTPNGYNWVYDLFRMGQNAEYPEYASWQIPTWEANPFIPRKDIDEARRTMSKKSFDQELGACFVSLAGSVFPDFDRRVHVKRFEWNPFHENTHGIDFGFRSFAFVARQYDRRTDTLYNIAEAEYKEVTTEQAVSKLLSTQWAPHAFGHKAIIGVDPAGRQTNDQTNKRNIDIVREMLPGTCDVRFSGKKVHRDPEWRADQIRARVLSADGSIRKYVHPGCTGTIRYLENSTYPDHREGKEEKTQPVKDGVVDHLRDADGYADVVFFHKRKARMGEERPPNL